MNTYSHTHDAMHRHGNQHDHGNQHRHPTHRRTAFAAGAVALALALSACGADRPGEEDARAGAQKAGKFELEVVEESAVPLSSEGVSVRRDAELGSVVVDSKGSTVYVSRADESRPGRSSCTDACAKTWLPVPAREPAAAQGVAQELLGSITRADGVEQLTIAGKPLYTYAPGKKGDTAGQGIKDTWYAAAPDGTRAGTERPALGVLNSPGLGRVLQDGNGRTLYLFTKDTPWPMKTACDAKCLEKWTPSEPVTAADAKAAGLDPEVLFPFTTPGGGRQESFNCWPAYTFKGDKKPGDTNGQGVGGVWFAIKADIPRSDRGRTVPAAKG
ncbi:SCO0930 family lipoprotein [Streptomyces liliiviolaceus]|nr:SCO0930 family lipoprotein [Streptomyces liliiviolaceus]